jgi:hypothetical protein
MNEFDVMRAVLMALAIAWIFVFCCRRAVARFRRSCADRFDYATGIAWLLPPIGVLAAFDQGELTHFLSGFI